MATEQRFAKWGPLLLLCRDGLRVLPRGWREEHVDVYPACRGGLAVMSYVITDGNFHCQYTFGEHDLNAPAEAQKYLVARWFASVLRQIESRAQPLHR